MYIYMLHDFMNQATGYGYNFITSFAISFKAFVSRFPLDCLHFLWHLFQPSRLIEFHWHSWKKLKCAENSGSYLLNFIAKFLATFLSKDTIWFVFVPNILLQYSRHPKTFYLIYLRQLKTRLNSKTTRSLNQI